MTTEYNDQASLLNSLYKRNCVNAIVTLFE